jgi:hypothetical protein
MRKNPSTEPWPWPVLATACFIQDAAVPFGRSRAGIVPVPMNWRGRMYLSVGILWRVLSRF